MVKDIIRGVVSIAGSKIGSITVTLVTTPILVRLLGSSNYGDYAAVISVLGLMFILVDAGMFDGLRKFVTERSGSSDWRSDIFFLYIRYGSLVALVGAGLLVMIAQTPVITNQYGADFRIYFVFAALILFFRQFFSLSRSLLMGVSLEHYAEPLRVLAQIIFGVIGIGLVYVGYGVNGVLFARLFALLLVLIIALYIVSEYVDIERITSIRKSEISRKRILSFNIQTVVLTFLMESMYHADILLLQPIQGSAATGFYKAALVISEFLWFAPTAIQTVFLHKTSELWSNHKYGQITQLASRATRYTTLFVLLLSIGLAALADPFVTTYYGSDFSKSIRPLLLLLPGTIGFAIARPIFAIGQGKGSLRILIVATAGAAIINLCLNILLIPEYGMTGAAVATSVGYGSMVIFHILAARSIGFDPLADFRPVRIVLTVLAGALPIFSLAWYIELDLLALVVVPPVGLLVYSALAITTGSVTVDEIRELIMVFNS